jgi:hypothetical protein
VDLTSVSPSNITHSRRTPVRFKLDTPRVAPDHDVSCIVEAHGYCGAIFDYRGFGASTGEPNRATPRNHRSRRQTDLGAIFSPKPSWRSDGHD